MLGYVFFCFFYLLRLKASNNCYFTDMVGDYNLIKCFCLYIATHKCHKGVVFIFVLS